MKKGIEESLDLRFQELGIVWWSEQFIDKLRFIEPNFEHSVDINIIKLREGNHCNKARQTLIISVLQRLTINTHLVTGPAYSFV